MKTIWIMMIVMVAVVEAFGDSNGLLSVPEIAGGRLIVRGFAQVVATDAGNAQANVDFSVCRVKGVYERGSLKLGSEINFAEIDDNDSNWLRELWIGVKLTEKLELRVGRLFLSSGYATTPQFVLETVQYPKAAFFSCYGWGAQLSYVTKHWEARLDITDDSGSSFFGKDGRIATISSNVQRNFDDGSVGVTLQRSGNFWRFGLGIEFRPVQSLTLRGLACYESNANDHTSDRIGMYLLAAYRPIKIRWLEIHGQLDYVERLAKEWVEYQQFEGDDGSITIKRVELKSDGTSDTTLTIGTRLFFGPDDCFTLTIDCQMPLAEESARQDSKILARLQFRF